MSLPNKKAPLMEASFESSSSSHKESVLRLLSHRGEVLVTTGPSFRARERHLKPGIYRIRRKWDTGTVSRMKMVGCDADPWLETTRNSLTLVNSLTNLCLGKDNIKPIAYKLRKSECCQGHFCAQN
jgi:hypothetical protein